jgi:enoyl-CoA hydratase/carnithine racemase
VSSLDVRTTGRTRELTIDREAALNALDNQMLAGLLAEIGDAVGDAGVRCIVIAGAGGKAFCAGIDLEERRGLDDAGKMAQSALVLRLVQAVVASPKPVIASIGGWCLGAGLELALACDLRIASSDSRFAFPEMSLGAYPGGGGAVLLPRVVGEARALDWLLQPRRLDASQALAMGLLTRVIEPQERIAAALAAAGEIAKLAPLAVKAIKTSIRGGIDMPLAEAFAHDQSLRRPLDASRDYQEGLLAQREKRPPNFIGQ